LLAGLGVALSTSAAVAQDAQPRRFSAGIAGGVARGPAGDIGYHALASFEIRTPLHQARIRVDGILADWGGSFETGPVTSLSLNAIVAPMPGKALSPYLLAGGGGYAGSGAGMQAGWSVGAGLSLRGARSVFIETRLHTYRRTEDFLADRPVLRGDKSASFWTPLGVGIRF
jgi:hypothetical protein